jgi:hypothetical protein
MTFRPLNKFASTNTTSRERTNDGTLPPQIRPCTSWEGAPASMPSPESLPNIPAASDRNSASPKRLERKSASPPKAARVGTIVTIVTNNKTSSKLEMDDEAISSARAAGVAQRPPSSSGGGQALVTEGGAGKGIKVLQTRGASLQARAAKARLPDHLMGGLNIRFNGGGVREKAYGARLGTAGEVGGEVGPKFDQIRYEGSGEVKGWGEDGQDEEDGGWEGPVPVGGGGIFRTDDGR